jgi:deoxycytidylate deaminase
LSDFFVDNTVNRFLPDKSSNSHWKINDEISRLIKIVSGREIVRPSVSETAMHAATAAAMRSACLSRQVGAALLDRSGNLLSTGANEVPKAGGGVYGDSFTADAEDHRCAFRRLPDGRRPYCSNNVKQNEIVDKIVAAVTELDSLDGMRKATIKLQLRESGIGDLIEFSRAVHAEMDALLSAGRTGAGTVGTRLFVTTFPCHYCARHIVSAGIDEVQYIEPYPKSKAWELHRDSIALDPVGWVPPSEGGTKTLFRPFVGVSPRLYRRAFLKQSELKNAAGDLEVAPVEWGGSMLLRSANYCQLEAELAKA